MFFDVMAELNSIIQEAGSDFDRFAAAGHLVSSIADNSLHIEALCSILSDDLGGKPTPYELSAGEYVVLNAQSHCICALVRHNRARNDLYLVPNHWISRYIGGSPLGIQRYTSPICVDEINSRQKAPLIAQSAMELSPTELVYKDGRFDAIDLFTGGNTHALSIRINTIPFGNFEWQIDRTTLLPTKSYSLRPREDNLMVTLDLISDIRSKPSIEFIIPFVNHDFYHVRWKAIQTIARIDRELGFELVVQATNDSHPDIRFAAQSTLEHFC